jgi:RNA polymerase sigma factor (sigma-70 family)
VARESTFAELIDQLRRGDPAAAEEVVRRYEAEIRRAVHFRLTDPALRRVLDSVDVCQSVLANFFVRAAAGQFDLDEPEQLLKLLVVMARNRLRDHVSQLHAARRDQRRLDPRASVALSGAMAGTPTPSAIIAGRDLLERVVDALPSTERKIAQLRAAGLEWAEIAEKLGEKPDAVRKRLARALDRVGRDLGLEEVSGV